MPTPSSTRPTEHHVLMIAMLSMIIMSPSVSSHHTRDHLCVCLSQLPARVERTSSPSPTLKPVRTWPSPLSSTSRCASVLTLTKSSVSDQVKHTNTHPQVMCEAMANHQRRSCTVDLGSKASVCVEVTFIRIHRQHSWWQKSLQSKNIKPFQKNTAHQRPQLTAFSWKYSKHVH